MSNNIVRKFFQNYNLIRDGGFDLFRKEQSKLFSPDLLTLASDKRGNLTYYGIDGFFEGMVAWSKHFFVNGESAHEFLKETDTHVLVRMHGDLALAEPINESTVSKANGHDWTQEFELLDGLITKVEVRLSFY
ncbi:hypothetical protein ACPOL_2564 [Acidisarcina polymorpha]|uniref:SnoaL-like domain-containing protein n=1 Tax=Acidisarcina polymorpha TaxID=2211140 RepID=A0A2Z5FZC2_9BACT|nr:hypothetical protein [Acidisarcina polymorpha]AXC11884.1 hypothetical protein ACPOL_2564 [Acidisarcina polymorpha]